MAKLCGTSGGKGNVGMFIEREHKVCAAGVPSLQATKSVANCLKHYLMQEEVDALISDSISPSEKPLKLPPLRHPPKEDRRNAGPYSETAELVNPPIKTKFQTLIQEFKETTYTSYWKKSVGKVQDPLPNLPPGFDFMTTLGKPTPSCGRLYDIVMPKEPVPDKTPKAKPPGYQTQRNYCSESFNPNIAFGLKATVDSRGIHAKGCLTYEDCVQGTNLRKPMNTLLSNFRDENISQLGVCKTPNNNIRCVPKGHTFGKLEPPSSHVVECLTTCELNPNRELFMKCIAQLNTLRKFLAKRFESIFFRRLYLSLKYCDEENKGWLPKEMVYKHCQNKLVRINPDLMEPLLSLWNAFDGTQIEYKTFVHVINFTQILPELPKIWDIPDKCIDFRTTYTEMVKPGQEIDKRRMANLPSGRYFDKDYPVTPNGFCKADQAYLPEESDAKSCLCPSILTLFGVNHRDMYAKRDPQTVRKVFEGAGQKFDDEKFYTIWNNAKKYHSQGWVCFETFRRSVNESENDQLK